MTPASPSRQRPWPPEPIRTCKAEVVRSIDHTRRDTPRDPLAAKVAFMSGTRLAKTILAAAAIKAVRPDIWMQADTDRIPSSLLASRGPSTYGSPGRLRRPRMTRLLIVELRGGCGRSGDPLQR